MTPAALVDLTAPEFVVDPYPALATLRRTGPVLWHEPTQMWLAATHAAVSAVLRDRGLGRIWVDREPAEVYAPFNALHRHQMMENEPPTHTRLRRLVASAFTRGHVERLRPSVEAIARELIEAFPAHGEVDILSSYAEPLPVAVIAELLGVPAADRPLLRDWSQAIVRMYEYDRTPATEAAAVAASVAFSDYVRELVAFRRDNPGPDLITDLIAARDEGTALSQDELVASVVLLLNAGHEASVNVFGNGVVALLRHEGERMRVASGEVGWETALEELIRYDAPLQLFERTATRDVVVAGVDVRAGQKVAALMGSANRDGAVFEGKDALDVSRDPNPHVGFGMGLHFCLGAPLARMELQISLRALFDRYPGVNLARAPDPPRKFVLRGYDRVDVVLGTGVNGRPMSASE
jgi:cytochrome P450